MQALGSRDLRAALEFVETAWALADRRAFPPETLVALSELIPCDDLGYSDLDRVRRRVVDYVGPEEGDVDDDHEAFWRIVDEHPLCRHHQAYADFSAIRLSDVISRPRLVNSRIYAEWFRPVGIAAELEVGLTRSRTRTRNFVLDRSHGDFSLRDRAVLELVRPHLRRIHEMTELRRAAGASQPDDAGAPHRSRGGDPRARRRRPDQRGDRRAAVGLAGHRQEHLENVYAKLGVANRAAAVVRITPTPRNGDDERRHAVDEEEGRGAGLAPA